MFLQGQVRINCDFILKTASITKRKVVEAEITPNINGKLTVFAYQGLIVVKRWGVGNGSIERQF